MKLKIEELYAYGSHALDIQLNRMKMSKWTLIFYSKGSNINMS